MAGQVCVEGKVINKSGYNIKPDAKIKIKDIGPEWVSRGAYKLIKALDENNIKVDNKTCMDLGASTGGFTEVLVKRNAKKVFAVDVGTNQLHEKLKKMKEIINIEKTNARYLTKDLITEFIELLVCDVSFISLKKVILPCLDLLKNKSIIIVLIKPQFEASKKLVGKKGIIRDEKIHNNICENINFWFIENFSPDCTEIINSPVLGQKGNKEFLIYVKKN